MELDPQSLATPEQVDTIRGKIIALCELVDISEFAECQHDFWASGPYCWLLENVRPLANPIPAKGRLGLWNADLEF